MSAERPRPATIEFSYRNVNGGWCDVTLASGTQSVVLGPSYLTDALHDLLVAVRDMLLHDRFTVSLWANEPGTIELVFARSGGTVRVRVRMIHDDDLWFGSDDTSLYDPAQHDGKQLFDAEGDALDFASRVAAEAELVLDGLGAAGYEEEWCKPFPNQALRELRLAIDLRR